MKKNYHILVCLALVALAGLLACGKPAIKHGSIDGTVRTIENWRIEWQGEEVPVEQGVPIEGLTDTKTKYTLPEYCLRYVGEVKHELATRYGFSFYENVPPGGRIEVKLYGTRVARTGNQQTEAAELMEELTNETYPGGYVESAVREEGFYWGKDDIVKQVDIAIYDVTGRLLGEIFVGGDDAEQNVEPEYAAKAINRIIHREN
ncbi:hypothetical protein GF420_14005 [candidate division GN15 bacterium]|nr:hypothetical protein [candidate division GN15 bacterium]